MIRIQICENIAASYITYSFCNLQFELKPVFVCYWLTYLGTK